MHKNKPSKKRRRKKTNTTDISLYNPNKWGQAFLIKGYPHLKLKDVSL